MRWATLSNGHDRLARRAVTPQLMGRAVMQRSGLTYATGLVLIALLSGCVGAVEEGTAVVTDSAGIAIVAVRERNADPSSVASAPRRTEAGPFAGVGTISAGADGSLLVPERMSPRQLSLLSEDAPRVVTVGRPGEGPGEFRALSVTQLLGSDRVLVLDQRQGRWTTYDRAGKLLDGASYPLLGSPVAANKRGDVLFGRTPLADPAPSGRIELSRSFSIWNLETGAIHALDRELTVEMHFARTGEMVVRMDTGWERAPEATVGPDRLAISDPIHSEVLVYDLEGDLLEILRFSSATPSVTESDWAAWVEWRVASFPPELRSLERSRLRDLPRAETLPVTGRLLFDDRGRLWVERFTPPHVPREVWDVFDASGAIVMSRRMPPGFSLHQVRGVALSGVSTDSLGVETVVVFDLAS